MQKLHIMASLPFNFLARSELLSTFFPTWLWQGREWRKGHVPRYDPHYWFNAHSHPVLSTYYPTHILSAIVGTFLPLDTAFNLYIIHYLLHFVFMLAGWYTVFAASFVNLIALFGAITMTFQACHLKQQACIVYTLSWFPWMLHGLISHNVILSSVSIGMMLLAGYYPLAVFLLPVSLIFWQWLPIGVGFLIGLPQLIPFFKYLPRTIRGSVKAPSDSPTENKFYFGLTPIVILILSYNPIYLVITIPILFRLFKSTLMRVPQRAMILSCYGAIYFCLLEMRTMSNTQIAALTLIQAFDLWLINRDCLPPRPFCELWEKPSRAFNTKLTRFLEKNLGDGRVAGLPYPLFTGHINGFKTIGYCGSMQNNLMWKWRKSFKHDPFLDGVNGDDITRYRVRFAYSRKKLPWQNTEVPNLYLNPNYSN